MISQNDVKLADLFAEREKVVKKLRWEQEQAKAKELERQEEFRVQFYGAEGKVREAETLMQASAEARMRIYQSVPLEVRQLADRAAAAVRVHLEEFDRARRDEVDAVDRLAVRRMEEKRTGFKITKDELAARQADVDAAGKARQRVEATHKDLERRAQVAKAAVEAAVAQARKAAK